MMDNETSGTQESTKLYDRSGIPRTYDRSIEDDSFLYPDQESYKEALIAYADEHYVDRQVILTEYKEHKARLRGEG